MKKFILFLFVILITQDFYSQTLQDNLKFYPLAVGNTWIYHWSNSWDFGYEEQIITIKVVTKQTLGNSKEYFRIEKKFSKGANTITLFERIDSINGLIYMLDYGCEGNERIIEDFSGDVGDTLSSTRFLDCGPYVYTYYFEKGIDTTFNQNRQYKIFENAVISSYYKYKLTKDIGISYIYNSFDFGIIQHVLKGCLINGVLYGDTTATDVELENNLTPNEFNLSQNYPNPFNPSTTIKFQIPKASQVKLEVYDVLGNLIQTVVDEYKSAGNYQTEVNLSNLSSGIYLYKLQAGDFISSKKMMLMK
ncbi:MAG TPA: T9SS type A sorting domain-containing protein [Ignavibacteriaceae bacterium]|nr:T9SS type A sorting domain-containing protein [Ignavibacteriaceae bacterium]